MSTLSFSQTIKAPPSLVYRYLTNSSALREYLCDMATTDPKVGGRVYLAWNDGYYTAGTFTELKENELVAYTWFGKDEPGPTQVKFTLRTRKVGTQLYLKHSGIGRSKSWQNHLSEFEHGWQRALENLVSALETGQDLRFTLRPMLGIGLDSFNEEIAKKLGIPVTQGIRLESTLEGMGARAAGLQKDDVIVELGGKPTPDYPDLTGALSAHRAGDTIPVGFYRGSEKKTVQMTLSGRPIPEIPATAKELAGIVKGQHQDSLAKLTKLFEGVSEEEASFKPAPDEWSAKETLAHLIQGERNFGLRNITDLIDGHEAWYDGYGDNSLPAIEATVVAYGSLAAMLDSYSCAMAETAALLERLPDEFVHRKPSFWRLAYGFLQYPYHDELHLAQMKAAIQAARRK